MRRLGVYGANLPTRKERSVEPADFNIAGLMGFFDRKFAKPFRVTSDVEAKAIFGEQTNKNYYGWDCLNGFFANLKGTSGSIYVYSPIGSSGIQARMTCRTGPQDPVLLVAKSAYQGEDDVSDFGNNTGLTVKMQKAIETSVVSITPAGGISVSLSVDGCAGFYVGDMIGIPYYGYQTGGIWYGKITAISETQKTITATGAGGSWSDSYTVSDKMFKVACNIKTYRKSSTGLVTEVDKSLGNTLVTFNPNDPDTFVENVFAQSSYLKIETSEDSNIMSIINYFNDGALIVYLSSGQNDDDSVLSNAETHYHAFDSLPVRILAFCETANTDTQSALEQYCRNREDNPIAVLVAQFGLNTKQSMKTLGNIFQRSDEVDALLIGNWLGVPDPFSTSPTAKDREVPCVGHVMGEWIYSIEQNGIHSSPARKNCTIIGVNSVLGYTANNDLDRTDLAESGVNVIQKMQGKGFILRNAFTPSTAKEFRYANAVIQRNYIKVSCVESLGDSENTPNTIGNVREDRMAVLQFMNKLWRSGSNGSVKEGETFGQYEKEDGSISTTEDAFEVIADASNNSVATLQAGERNVDIWFMFPAPAGSIKVGVGLIYKTIS